MQHDAHGDRVPEASLAAQLLSCPAGRAPCTSALPTRMACREKIPQSSCMSVALETSRTIGQRSVGVAKSPSIEVVV